MLILSIFFYKMLIWWAISGHLVEFSRRRVQVAWVFSTKLIFLTSFFDEACPVASITISTKNSSLNRHTWVFSTSRHFDNNFIEKTRAWIDTPEFLRRVAPSPRKLYKETLGLYSSSCSTIIGNRARRKQPSGAIWSSLFDKIVISQLLGTLPVTPQMGPWSFGCQKTLFHVRDES